MKRFLITCIALSTFAAIKAEAFDWSMLSTLFGSTNQTAAENSATTVQDDTFTALKEIQKQADVIDSGVRQNFLSIVSLLSTKKETNSIKSQITQVLSDNAKTDTEKAQMFNQILTTYASSVSGTKSLSKLSASQKIELVKQITSIEQSGQQYASLAKQAITASASNVLKTSTSAKGATAEDIVSIIEQTNQTASLIKTKATNTINLANQFRTIAQNAGIIK